MAGVHFSLVVGVPVGAAAASPKPASAATAAVTAAETKHPASLATAVKAEVAEDQQPLVLRLPHKETLPSSLETPILEEATPLQQQPHAAATTLEATAEAGNGKEGAANTSSAANAQRPPVRLSNCCFCRFLCMS